MATIALENLVKRYGATQVVHGIDLTVEDGEFVVLVGPSGCGKSTTLRMIAGLEEPTSGTISIDGRVVNQLEPKARNIAMVFQNYAIYPHVTVGANIGFGLYNAKLTKAEKQARIINVARTLGLEPLLDRRPAQLSGGQRQRVAIGRAMVRNPAAFLFDEPLSNLDAQLRSQMRVEIRRLHQELHATSVFVTHDQVEAMTMADRIVVMRDGHILQIGKPMELYDRPVDVFTAKFIGSPTMNLMANIRPELLMGVRPQALVVGQPTGEAFSVTGRVLAVETLGAETLVHVDIGGQTVIGGAPPKAAPAIGETVILVADPADLHWFDAMTERAC